MKIEETIDAYWTTEFTATESSDGQWHALDLAAPTPRELVELVAAEDLGVRLVVFRNSRCEIIDEYQICTNAIKRVEKCRLCRRPLQRGGYDYTLT